MVSCIAKHRRSWTGVVGLVCLFLSVGCGGDGSDSKFPPKPRVSASGKVEMDGKPLASGTINFGGAEMGTKATATISSGSYSIGSSRGPNPGTNTVSVTGGSGDDTWVWIKAVDVPETGFKGDFSFTADETKKVTKIKGD